MKLFLQIIGGVLMGLGIFLFFLLKSLPDGKLHVFVLDVGQGDSILIQTPNNEYILIDGGPNNQVITEIAKIMPFYAHQIDLVILSHPHQDHINGLVDVMKRVEVKAVMMTGVKYGYAGYEEFLGELHEAKISPFFVDGEFDYQLGNIVFDMLYPTELEQNLWFENQNNASIVFRLLYGQKRFYFGGDAEKEVEADLVKSGLNLSADFYKVSHHGSKTSSTIDFLNKMKPAYAAISCGIQNRYGHPFPNTLENLQAIGAKILRTDIDGTIEAVSDGESIIFHPLNLRQ